MIMKKKESCCYEQICGICTMVLGILVVLNSIYTLVSWSLFVGIAITIWGLIVLIRKT